MENHGRTRKRRLKLYGQLVPMGESRSTETISEYIVGLVKKLMEIKRRRIGRNHSREIQREVQIEEPHRQLQTNSRRTCLRVAKSNNNMTGAEKCWKWKNGEFLVREANVVRKTSSYAWSTDWQVHSHPRLWLVRWVFNRCDYCFLLIVFHLLWAIETEVCVCVHI